MAAACFAAVPMELVEEIIDWLPVSGQATVSLVSRRFYSIAMPFMYRHNRRHDGSSALGESVILANIEGIERALEQGLDVNARDEHGRTVLHHAVTYKDGCTYRPGSPLECILQLLLDSGANPTAKDLDHVRPFDLACQRENYAAALFFLQKQAAGEIDLKLNAAAVNRALHEAVQPLGHWDTEGHDEGIRDVYEENIEYLRKNQRELVRQLLGMKGVRFNARLDQRLKRYTGPGPPRWVIHCDDITLLHSALMPRPNFWISTITPDIEVVRLLLEAGTRPNACATTGDDWPFWTPLHLVVKLVTHAPSDFILSKKELVDLVELLVAYGARLDTVGGPHSTYPFFYAIKKAFYHCGYSEDYSMLMAIIKAMLDCKGPKDRTKENPRPAKLGILPKGHMSRAADMLVELCEMDHHGAEMRNRDENKITEAVEGAVPIELLRLLSDYGCESKKLEFFLKNYREDSSEEDESDCDDEDENENEERPSKRDRDECSEDSESDSEGEDEDEDEDDERPSKRRRTMEGTGAGQADTKTTRSGRRYG
ncbi:Ankyrin repeat-containing domain protein [Rhypophila sp. PSN 637]